MISALCTLLLLSSPALAGDAFGTVGKLTEPDAAGRWKSVKVSTQASVITDSDPIPLAKGMALDQGVTVRSMLAVAEIDLASGNTLRLDPGAEVILKEPTFIEQLAGEVLYQVKGAFSVKYGTVHCTVEGTEFEVVGASPYTDVQAPGDHPRDLPTDALPGTISVAVTKGKVRVSTPEGEVLVKKGSRVMSGPDGVLSDVQNWRMCDLCGYPHVPHDD